MLFGSAAEQYERYRAGYDDAVFATVADYAGRPLRTALEVGAGTGKATRLFATHGVHVTALEPDAGMAALLADTTRGLPVELVLTSFESFESGAQFDLVYAAAAWHWTDPRTRWTRAVERLRPGGTLAVFGRPYDLKDPDLFAAVDAVERELVHDGDGVAGQRWSTAQATATDGLTEVTERVLTSEVTVPAVDFVARLSTVSAYLALSAEARRRALDEVRARLPERVLIDTTTRLLLARRTGSA
ncbi:MAG: methyltransferase domain-containing protein [Actinobacteria bacterium]|nr:methyltransferase domain-containing protein [Actinomycetota bacterium]